MHESHPRASVGEGLSDPRRLFLASEQFTSLARRFEISEYFNSDCARETPLPVPGRYLPAIREGYSSCVRSLAVFFAWHREQSGCKFCRSWLQTGRGTMWSTGTAGVTRQAWALCRHSSSAARIALRVRRPRLSKPRLWAPGPSSGSRSRPRLPLQ